MPRSTLLDKYGKRLNISIQPRKKMFGLVNSIYEYPNAGRYRPRTYTTQDSELGISAYNRDMTQRLCREMLWKQPWIYTAIKLLSNFSVGGEYKVRYTGDNSGWGSEFENWARQSFYPNCCVRGPMSFSMMMKICSRAIDSDGDIGLLLGDSGQGPQVQLIPSNRIRSSGGNPFVQAFDEPKAGPYPNTIISDGVVYSSQGTPQAYCVQNMDNMVNASLWGGNKSPSTYVSAKDLRLVYCPQLPDRGRGFPSISAGIIQALDCEAAQAALLEKLKVQSMYAVVEKVPESEGPYEEEQNFDNLLSSNQGQALTLQGLAPIGINPNYNNNQGLQVVEKPSIKYVSSQGGDIKFPNASITDKESSDFITRLEMHVLGCLGVPHALLFTPDTVSGKMNSSVVDIFNAAIMERQQLLDFHGKFVVAWAAQKAISSGDLPPNDDEVLYDIFNFSHPNKFVLDDTKQTQVDISAYQAGTMSLTELANKRNTTSEKILKDIEREQVEFFNSVNRIAKATSTDPALVAQSMKENLKSKAPPFGGTPNE